MKLEGYRINTQFTVPLEDGNWVDVEPMTYFVILENEVLVKIKSEWKKTTLTPKFIEVNITNGIFKYII
jgi:hypothetical protein